ncbi:MAG: hypothetical protein JOZ68_17665, partial [Acidimicrobiia bacterium]|nr:hypothetical protein [Acidimicrobiia bacterium]
MAAEEPRDFQVRLDWPEDEARPELAPAPATRKAGHRPAQDTAEPTASEARTSVSAEVAKAPARPTTDPGLTAVLRRLEAISQRVEALSRSVERVAPREAVERVEATLDQVAGRLDKVARAVAPIPKTVNALAERVDQVSSTVQNLPAASSVADLAGRVDGLVDVVRAMSSMYSSNTDRMAAALDDVSSQLRTLDGAAQNVRRLAAHVNSASAVRVARHSELQAEVELLAAELDAVRSVFPERRPAPAKRATKKKAAASSAGARR